jgi:hypothetical protein
MQRRSLSCDNKYIKFYYSAEAEESSIKVPDVKQGGGARAPEREGARWRVERCGGGGLVG